MGIDSWSCVGHSDPPCVGQVSGFARIRRATTHATEALSLFTLIYSRSHDCLRIGARREPAARQAIVTTAVEVDVLDGVEQLDAFGHRALERLAAGDEAVPPARLLMTAVARPRRGRSRPWTRRRC